MVLQVLYPKPESGVKPESLAVDIVAVHGLNGDATNTWKASESKHFWLQDFLPQDVEGARVLTFGYNADVAFGNTTASIKDHAMDLLGSLIDEREDDVELERPIVFVAHSLGGIIVKQALTWAHTEPQYRKIKDCTLGVVFFGTPHRGSDKANYGSVLANVATSMMRKPKSKIINALHTNSEELGRLTGEFRFQASNYHILTFYEMKPMKGLTSLIVEKHSALLEIPNEDQQPVDASHREMCQFVSRDDQAYQKLVKRLNRMLKSKGNGQPAQVGPPKVVNKHYEVPYNVSSVFTGRTDIGKELRKTCLPTEPMHLQTMQKRFVLYGLGGSGKTQVCLKFAQAHRENFWGIFFIDTSSADIAKQAFSTMAQACKIGDSMQDFKKFLSTSLDPWLLILDNADDPTLNISQFFPAGGRGTVIITTRNPDCKSHATAGSKEIGDLNRDEAINLLLRSSDHFVDDIHLRSLAQPIVEILGCLALAVTQAGASIRQRICSLEDYLQLYGHNRQKLLSSMPPQADVGYDYTVYTTWEISLDSLKKLANHASDYAATNALDLLTLFGFFHFDNITEDIFRSVWNHLPDTEGFPWWKSHQLRMIRERRSSSWDPIPFRKAVQLLFNHSLIRINGSNSQISLHPLVHSWIRDSLNEESNLWWWNTTLSTLALASKNSDYRTASQLTIHMRHCLSVRQLDGVFFRDDDPFDRIEIIYRNSLAFKSSHQWHTGILLLEKNLQYSEQMLGTACYSTCQVTNLLASLYNMAGEHQKACDLLEEIIDICIRVVGGADVLTLCMIIQLTNAYIYLNRKPEALQLAQKNMALCKASVSDSDESYTIALWTLANAYADLQMEEAVLLLEKVVDRWKETEKDGNYRVLVSKYDLARAYRISGQYETALEIFQEVIKISSAFYGEEGLVTLHVIVQLALVYGHMRQPDKGVLLITKALEAGKRIGVGSVDLGFWEELLKWLEALCKESSTIESLQSPHSEGQKTPSKERWKFWSKGRRRIAGSST